MNLSFLRKHKSIAKLFLAASFFVATNFAGVQASAQSGNEHPSVAQKNVTTSQDNKTTTDSAKLNTNGGASSSTSVRPPQATNRNSLVLPKTVSDKPNTSRTVVSPPPVVPVAKDAYDKEAERRKIQFVKDRIKNCDGSQTVKSFLTFLSGGEQLKIIGYNHEITEPKTFELLRRPDVIAQLKNQGITKVFYERHVAHAPVYNNAQNLTSAEFIKGCVETEKDYPNWYYGEDKKRYDTSLANVYETIVALKAAGINVIPYDVRNCDKEHDIGDAGLLISEYETAAKEVVKKQSLKGREEIYRHYRSYGPDYCEQEVNVYGTYIEETLLRHGEPTMVLKEKTLAFLLRFDEENFKVIENNMDNRNERAVILMGGAHQCTPNALADIFEKKGYTQTNLDFMSGEYSQYERYFVRAYALGGYRVPDALLSVYTGKMLGKNEIAEIMDGLQKSPTAQQFGFLPLSDLNKTRIVTTRNVPNFG